MARTAADADFKEQVFELQKIYEETVEAKEALHALRGDGFVHEILREKKEGKDEL